MTRQMLAIGPLIVDPPVVLAPMAGITNAPFRRLCREYGTDPGSMGAAVAYLVEVEEVDHIDMNFGCPMGKVTRHGGGAAIPWKQGLFRSIVRAAVSNAGEIPVTVKFRKGIDDDHLTYLETGLTAEEEGASAVALHARTARRLYSGEADWDAIARLKEKVTSIPVLGNGDIWTAGDALELMARTGCDGVVVGRGCLGRPWLFRDLSDTLAGRPQQAPPDSGEVTGIMIRHAELLVSHFGDRVGINLFRKHPSWYLKGFPAGPAMRDTLARVESADQLREILADWAQNIPFPLEADRMVRGHSHGPRPVRLPHGFLDHRQGDRLGREAEQVVSGG